MYKVSEDFEDCLGAEERPDYLEHLAVIAERERLEELLEIHLRLESATDFQRAYILLQLRTEEKVLAGAFF